MSSFVLACGYSQSGCPETFENEAQVKDHMGGCYYRMVKCIQCGHDEIYRHIAKHMVEFCDYRIVTCDIEGCTSEIYFKDLREHKENCPERIIACEYCGLHVVGKTLDQHHEECPDKPQECAMRDFGCMHTAPRDQILKHQKDVNLHFDLLCSFIRNEFENLEHHREECITTQNDLEEKLSLIKGSMNALENIISGCSHPGNEIKALHSMKAEILSRMNQNEKNISKLGETFKSNREEMMLIKGSLSNLHVNIAKQKDALNDITSSLTEKLRKQSREIDSLKELVGKLFSEFHDIFYPKFYTENIVLNANRNQNRLPLFHGCQYCPPANIYLQDINDILSNSSSSDKEIILLINSLKMRELLVSREIDEINFNGKKYHCLLTQCKGEEKCKVVLQLIKTIPEEEDDSLPDEVQAIWCILDPELPEHVLYYHVLDGSFSETKGQILFGQFSIHFPYVKDRMGSLYFEVARGNCNTAFLIHKKSENDRKEIEGTGEQEVDLSKAIPLTYGQPCSSGEK